MPRALTFTVLTLCAWLYAITDTSAHFKLKQGDSWVAIRFTLADSARITDFGSTHGENSTWARLHTFGQLGPKFSFEAQGSAFTDVSNRAYRFHDYQPYNGISYNIQFDADSLKRTWDWSSARSAYQLHDRIQIFAGLDYIRTGPAQRNPVSFRGAQHNYRPWQDSTRWNDQPAPMLQAGFDMNLAWIRYTQWTAQPKHHKHLNRYLHTHRVSLQLPFKIELGLAETILYGTTVEPAGSNPNMDSDSLGRTLEWIYTLPFVPFFFAEHYQGDRDNGAMGFDIAYRGIPRWEFFSELLLDDSKTPTSMLDDTWWGNKWAMSSGVRWQGQFRNLQAEWLLEYTRIEPWVYTHHKGAAYRYTHYGQSLGSELGPNSQELYTHMDLSLNKFSLRLSASSVAKDTAFGSQITDMHTPTDATNKVFLNKTSTISYQEFGAEFRIRPWSPVWVSFGFWQYTGDYLGIRAQSTAGITW